MFCGLELGFVAGIDVFSGTTDGSFVFGSAVVILDGHCLADYVREGLPRLRPLSSAAAVMAGVATRSPARVVPAPTRHALGAAREGVVARAGLLGGILILSSARARPARVLAPPRLALV